MSEIPLPILQTRLDRLPMGVLAERFALQTQIIALAHGQRNYELRDEMLFAAKESAFALVRTRSIRPHYALLAWGVAAATGNEALLHNLCRLPESGLSGGTKRHFADAPYLARYSRVLGVLHSLYRAILLNEDSEAYDQEIRAMLVADRGNKNIYHWIAGLHAMALTVRDGLEVDIPVRLHAASLRALKERRPLEPVANLDLAALGVLAIARRRNMERDIYPDTLPDLPLVNRDARQIA